MSIAAKLSPDPIRRIVHRSRGSSHGFVTRLMSPGDLRQILKPFVFLDLVDNRGETFPTFGLHPHSGLATLTYIAEGSVSYEDTNGATGILRASKGAWHAGGAGDPGHTRGFQLWVALPPDLELGPSESLYQSAADLPQAGLARVLLGRHDGAASAIAAPSSINYLAVEFVAGDNAEFALGSAAPHPHALVLGHYSVHTSPAISTSSTLHSRRLKWRPFTIWPGPTAASSTPAASPWRGIPPPIGRRAASAHGHSETTQPHQ